MSSSIPVDVDLVGTFVNTLDLESGADDLATPVDLHAWLRQRDLLPDDAKVTQRGLVNAIAACADRCQQRDAPRPRRIRAADPHG
jgi:hypothetical protein